MGVGVLDLVGVVEEVVPDRFVVGPVGGDAVDVGELLATLVHARLEFVVAVRLGRAIPETPGFALGCGFDEIDEIGRVVILRDTVGGGFELVLVVADPGDAAGFAVGIVGDPRSPSLAGDAHVPTLLHQDLGPAFELGGKHRHVVPRLLELPRMTSRQDDGPRGRALRHRCVGPSEEHPFLRDPVEARRLHPGRSISPRMGTPVVRDGEEEVRRRGIGSLRDRGDGEECQDRPELEIGRDFHFSQPNRLAPAFSS